jgi:hypothetical protein
MAPITKGPLSIWDAGANLGQTKNKSSECQAPEGKQNEGCDLPQGEIMKKTASFLIVMAMVLVTASSATSVASLKGVYAFQLQGLSNEFGYYSGSTWVNLNNSPCPSTQHCSSQAFSKISYGTVSFDGLGHVKFLTITNSNSGGGGPVVGTVWAYSVSGFNGAMGTSTNGAYLTLGDFSATGVAQTVLMRTEGNNPNTGTAVLQ